MEHSYFFAFGEHVKFAENIDITSIKSLATETIFPQKQGKEACTIMLLTNLARPEWISCACDDPILADVFCAMFPKHETNVHNVSHKEQSHTCLPFQIQRESRCYHFPFYKNNPAKSKAREICRKGRHFTFYNIADVNTSNALLEPLGDHITPILLFDSHNHSVVHLFVFDRLFLTYKVEKTAVSTYSEGFRVCISHSHSPLHMGSNMFQCKHKVFISYLFVCDGQYDCKDAVGSDELSCNCSQLNSNSSLSQMCRRKRGAEAMPLCPPLFHSGAGGTCSLFLSPSGGNHVVDVSSEQNLFVCEHGLKIDTLLVDDLVPDCGENAEDEGMLISLLRDGAVVLCPDSNQIPCRQGHSKCYNISRLCVYKLDKENHITPCRNGGHLRNCKDFECNFRFKCSYSHCIPWAYVCNDRWDCPTGIDEFDTCTSIGRCSTLFKCKETPHMCIHVGSVCDNDIDCPLGDDEDLCELSNILCPQVCNCLALAVSCVKLHGGLSHRVYPYLSVSVHMSSVRLERLFEYFSHVEYLHLHLVNLTEICDVVPARGLVQLTAAFASLSYIKANCFIPLWTVEIIQLTDSTVCHIEPRSFANLSKLNFLNLSNNEIKNLPMNLFTNSVNLKVLSLKNNQFTTIDIHVFQHLKLELIETTDYHICCVAPVNTRCDTERPWYISCSDLLPNDDMKYTFIVVSLLLLALNICAITFHILSKHKNIPYITTVVSVSLNDMQCGIYLCAVWITHMTLEGSFSVKEALWRSHTVCFLAFGISLNFNMLTACFLLFLSLSRLMIVMHPINTKFKETDTVLKSIFCMFTCTLCLTLLITFAVKLTQNTLPSNLCSPFVDPSNSTILFKITTCLVAIIQLCASGAIVVLHYCLVKELKISQKNIRKSSDDTNRLMLFQLVIITSSNILCWFPTNSIYVAAMFLSSYPSSMVIWTAVAVAPINSVINPAVFMFTSIRKHCRDSECKTT